MTSQYTKQSNAVQGRHTPRFLRCFFNGLTWPATVTRELESPLTVKELRAVGVLPTSSPHFTVTKYAGSLPDELRRCGVASERLTKCPPNTNAGSGLHLHRRGGTMPWAAPAFLSDSSRGGIETLAGLPRGNERPELRLEDAPYGYSGVFGKSEQGFHAGIESCRLLSEPFINTGPYSRREGKEI